ncbi:hypothetical protein PI95_017970, partial [Hassallia byssoidea VB512170]|nr:hypothetical protein [Hassalia byssoidea VB512170]
MVPFHFASLSFLGHWAMGKRASGMGHRAWGIGHGASGMGHRAWGMERKETSFYSHCPLPIALAKTHDKWGQACFVDPQLPTTIFDEACPHLS